MSEDQVDLRKVAVAVATIFLLAGALSITDWIKPMDASGSNTWQISASYDDVRRYHSTSNGDGFTPTAVGNPAGFATSVYMAQGCGLRFNGVNIDQGATINSAYLNMCSRTTKTVTVVNSNITAEAADNATIFTDMADYDGRTHTGNYTHWDAIPAWTDGTWYQSPDIKDVIQEVIDRSGWVSGNSLVVFWDDHDDRSSHVSYAIRIGQSYDLAPANAPILNVTWGAGGDNPPTFSQASHNTTVAGCACNFSCLVSDDIGLSKGKVETNNTGTYTNSSLKSLSGTSDTLYDELTLNTTVGVLIRYKFYANDSTNQWAGSSWYTLTTTQGGILGEYSFESNRRTGLRFAPQQKVFYAQNRHWVFYGNDTSDKIEYRTSINGLIFTSAITVYDPLAETFGTWNNNTHVAVVVDTGNYSSSDSYIPYRLGALQTDGTITWVTGSWQTALDITGANFIRPNVYVAADGTPWVTASNGTYTTGTSHVTRSSETNGTWVTDSGFPVDTNLTITHHSFRGALFELSSVGMYLIAYDYGDRVEGRLYNYTTDGWESIEQESTTWDVRRVDYAIDSSNVIHILGGEIDGSPVAYFNRTASGFSSRMTVGAYDTSSPVYRGETVVTHGADVYLFWRNTTTTIIQKNKTAGSWNTKFVWKTTSASGTDNGINGFCSTVGNLVGFAWETGTSNPRTLKYDFFTLASTGLTTGWNDFYAWSVDVGHTLGEVNASIWVDSVEFSVFTLEFANGTQVSFWRDSIANASVEVEAVTDTFWVYCTVAGEWKHSY